MSEIFWKGVWLFGSCPYNNMCGMNKERNGSELNYLLLLDDPKLFRMNLKQMDALFNTVRVFSHDFGMELWLNVLWASRRDRINFPSEVMMPSDQSEHSYQGITELDKFKEKEMKESDKRKEGLCWFWNSNWTVEITAINSWAVRIIQYRVCIIDWGDWKDNELMNMDWNSGRHWECMGCSIHEVIYASVVSGRPVRTRSWCRGADSEIGEIGGQRAWPREDPWRSRPLNRSKTLNL